jgi:hypothetical protein
MLAGVSLRNETSSADALSMYLLTHTTELFNTSEYQYWLNCVRNFTSFWLILYFVFLLDPSCKSDGDEVETVSSVW